MAKINSAEIIYPDKNGKICSKKIKLPHVRYYLGICKQIDEYVTIGYFTRPISQIPKTDIGQYYKNIRVTLPKGAGRARLKVGKRVISVAK